MRDKTKPTVEVARVDDVNGWPLAVVRGAKGEEPRLSHRVLAERAGYADAKDFLALAPAALGDDWKLRVPSAEFREGARGPLSKDWMFNRRESLEMLMLSTKPGAKLIRGQVLDVFEAWLDGRLGALPLTMAQIAVLVAETVKREVSRVLAADAARREADCGIIGPAKATRFIKHELLDLAKRSVPPMPALPSPEATLRAGREYVRSYMKARTRLDNELRGRIGFSGSGRAWSNLPERDLPDVKLALAEMRGRVEAQAKDRAAKSAQVEMFSAKEQPN